MAHWSRRRRGAVRWASTRADLPRVRVWIGPYKNLHGVVEPTIQFNDSFENDGQGKDARSASWPRRAPATSSPDAWPTVRRKAYDADFLTTRKTSAHCGRAESPIRPSPSGTTGTARAAPPPRPTTSIRPSGAPNGPAAGPDSGPGPLRGRQVGEVEAPVRAQLDLAVGRHVGVEQRGEAGCSPDGRIGLEPDPFRLNAAALAFPAPAPGWRASRRRR